MRPHDALQQVNDILTRDSRQKIGFYEEYLGGGDHLLHATHKGSGHTVSLEVGACFRPGETAAKLRDMLAHVPSPGHK